MLGRTNTLLVETVERTIISGMGNTKKLKKTFTLNFTRRCISIKLIRVCNIIFSETSHNTENASLCVTQY